MAARKSTRSAGGDASLFEAATRTDPDLARTVPLAERMRPRTLADLVGQESLVGPGSPLDKAGSYGIQDDRGALFIDRIDGDYYTIVGLPIAKVYRAIVEIIDGITSTTGHD